MGAALERATEALLDTPGDVTAVERDLAYNDARAAVSAALHDPDDDVIARALYEHAYPNGPSWESREDWQRGHFLGQADAVRAAILGGAS